MGVQTSSQSEDVKLIKKPSETEQKIQGLYEMYNETLKLIKTIHHKEPIKNVPPNHQNQFNPKQSSQDSHEAKDRKLLKKSRTSKQKDEELLAAMIEPFYFRRESYSWGSSIPELFSKYFSGDFCEKHRVSKELFYELLLENCGLKDHGELMGSQRQKREEKAYQSEQLCHQKHFQNIVKSQLRFTGMRSSLSPNELNLISLRQDEAEGGKTGNDNFERQSQEAPFLDDIANINATIIDQSFANARSPIGTRHSQLQKENIGNCREDEEKPIKEVIVEDDDKYFLPLITKRRRNPPHSSQGVGDQTEAEVEIEMSELPAKASYSKYRIEASSVILPNTIFYERMNFSSKVQTDYLVQIYRQISNTVQQVVRSTNLISCPMKHFLLYFQHKITKKKINSQAPLRSSNGHQETQAVGESPPSKAESSVLASLILSNCMDERSETARYKRQFNNDLLLEELHQFTDAYTEFLFLYLNLEQLAGTELEKFVNMDTLYGVVLKHVWGGLSWLAQRGYEWEEHALRSVIIQEHQDDFYEWAFSIETSDVSQNKDSHASHIKSHYAKFVGRQVSKTKVHGEKLLKAYAALQKLENEHFPQRYLKKIIVFYREATGCCEGADDLITVYEFLLKNAAVNRKIEPMRLFKMKNIIEKLLNVEELTVEGGGQIVYAWTTWNILLEMFLLKLKDYKQKLKKKHLEEENSCCDGDLHKSASTNRLARKKERSKRLNNSDSKKSPETERKDNPEKVSAKGKK